MNDRTPACTSPFKRMLYFLAGGVTRHRVDGAVSALAGDGAAKLHG